jgi:hypothetical protein
MWEHFKELGKLQRGLTREIEICEHIFQQLKIRLGEGGRFFKKSKNSRELFEVNDAVARRSE